MNKMKSILYKITCAIMIFFFACIFLQTTGNSSHMPLSESFLGTAGKPLFFVSGAALLLLIFFFLNRLLAGLTVQKRRIALTLMAAFGIALQLFLIFSLRPCLQYDALKPVDAAIAMNKGIPLAATQYYSYFTIYPHNVPLTLYIMLIFKAAGFLGIAVENYIVLLQLLNCLLFDLALVQMYRLLKRHFGIQKCSAFALLCLLNPLVYYYPVFFYTQVLSIPLFVLLITVFHRILDAETTKKKLLYGALYGIVLFFAWKIRFFTLITLIACAMFLFFHKSETKMPAKTILLVLVCALVTFGASLAAHNVLMTKYSVHTEESQAFPIHHWIMMGLQGDGTFYYADEDFTAALPFKSVRIEENTKVIKERLKQLGIGGLIRLWGRKLNITWSDGYDDYASNLMLIQPHNSMTDLLNGWRAEYLAAYLHIYNCMSWLLLLLCAVSLFRKGAADSGYTICITLLGGILFHLIWEAGEQYSMPFSLLAIAGAALGTDLFFRPAFSNVLHKKTVRRSLILIPVLAAAQVLFLVPKLLHTEFSVTETAAIQNLVGGEALCLTQGDTITQTVQASRPFDKLTLLYKYYGEEIDKAKVTLRLYDGNGNCLNEQTLPLESVMTITDIDLPEIVPDGKETYTIELSGEKIPDGSRVGFASYNTKNWDVYEKGGASLGSSAIENADIYFELTNRCRRTLL